MKVVVMFNLSDVAQVIDGSWLGLTPMEGVFATSCRTLMSAVLQSQ